MVIRYLGVALALSLAPAIGACTSGPDAGDDALERCEAQPDAGARKACIEAVLRNDVIAREGTGVGPPPCHPASTDPARGEERC